MEIRVASAKHAESGIAVELDLIGADTAEHEILSRLFSRPRTVVLVPAHNA